MKKPNFLPITFSAFSIKFFSILFVFKISCAFFFSFFSQPFQKK